MTMNRNELINLLIQMGIHQSSYSFDRIRNSECIEILEISLQHIVYIPYMCHE